MRYLHRARFFCLLLLSFGLQDCSDRCKVTNTYTYYKPVYSTSAEVRASVRYEAPRQLTNLGKIYLKDNYLFLNEMGEGIHVIDNRDPSVPTMVGFLKIRGNYDLAMVGNYLYADSFIDLIVFDATDKTSIKEVDRIERVFDHGISYGYPVLANNKILTDWQEAKTVDVYESQCDVQIQPWGGRYFEDGIAMPTTGFNVKASAASTLSTGIGGSMARFTISQNTLYALDLDQMDVINIAQPDHPVIGGEVEIGWDVETLFPYKDKLFAGSRSGMYIYDLKNPLTPGLLSKFGHFRSCDPVVVDDSFAYVTLRNGNSCQGFTNELEVVDITNLSAPRLVKTFPMTNPHGLGIDNKILFICDGADGLKIFDATDVNAIDANRLAHYPGIQALDIIPFQNIAIMISNDGLYQYNYADPKNINLISKLAIAR